MSVDEYQSSAILYDYCISPLLRGMRRDIRTYINYKGYKQIIDFCCGTGDQLRLLDGPEMSLCGIDNSLAMLKQARSNCSNRIDLHLLDAEHDRFAPETFDCAIISFGLHDKHPAAAESIFQNCRKVVRQGGALILADYSMVPSSFPGKAYSSILVPLIERLAGKTHYLHYRGWMKQGGLEGFLGKQLGGDESIDIISRPFGCSVLCCAIGIDEYLRSRANSFTLLNQSLKQ